jgi:hypothetical protein
LNAPSDGSIHTYPVDCWRFYPDCGQALVKWAKRNDFDPVLLECYTQIGGLWQDYVAVFLKDRSLEEKFNDRILKYKTDFENGRVSYSETLFNPATSTQNERQLRSRTVKGIFKKLMLIDLVRRALTPTPPRP